MKKLTALCLTFVLAFALSVPAFATSSDTVVNADIINFTPEEIAEQKAIDARLREEFSSAPETRGVVDRVPLLYLISKLTHIIAAQQVLKWYMKALPVIHLITSSGLQISSVPHLPALLRLRLPLRWPL